MKLKEEMILRGDGVSFIMKEEIRPYRSNRGFKDGIFRLLFSEKETALELLNALEETDYGQARQMEIVTLQDAIHNRMLNDLAFQYQWQLLSIVEHQSTWCENMPLRELLYLGRLYEKILDNQSMYRNGIYRIPQPRFHVLYNGRQDKPLETIQRLSDSYSSKKAAPALEAYVRVININYEKQHPILERSPTLNGYAQFVARVRSNMAYDAMDRDEAINDAIRSCIKDGILAEFLKKHGSEVYNMLFMEVTDEDIMNIRVEEAVEEAVEKAVEEAVEKAVEETVEKTTKRVAQETSENRERELTRTMAQNGMRPEEIARMTEIALVTVKQYLK